MTHMIRMPERNIDITGNYDVVISGGGPAGICAALSASRQGSKVLVIEDAGCLGGHWTSAMLSVMLDAKGKGGIATELRKRLSDGAGVIDLDPISYSYDVEEMKFLLEELCLKEDIEILLHAKVTGVRRSDKYIQAVIVEGSGGVMAFSGKVYLDCTGNGDVGAYAGCSFEVGHPVTGQVQPASLIGLVIGVSESFESNFEESRKIEFRKMLESVGITPSYRMPILFRTGYGDLWCFSINHQYGVKHDDTASITKAMMEGRREMFRATKALKQLPGWEKFRLVSTAEKIGLREGRRHQGLYRLTLQDISSGARFEDGICTVHFPVDIHSLEENYGGGYGSSGIKIKPYHIPYRCLVSAEIENLGFAGRCISGDFFAHASYRVTGNVSAMGEALGYAAAIAVKERKLLKEIDGKQVSLHMQNQGYVLQEAL